MDVYAKVFVPPVMSNSSPIHFF